LNLTRKPMQVETRQSATMVFRRAIGTALACLATLAVAQTSDVIEPTEEVVAPPSRYSKDGLLPIEMPPYVSLKIGIDPNTIAITPDGVLRYVVVMRNTSGTANVAYEGIQCAKGQVKTYARVSSAGSWISVSQPQWRSLVNNSATLHAQAIAQQGGCEGVNSGKREDVINALKGGQRSHYAN
jgi:hypothetical protein